MRGRGRGRAVLLLCGVLVASAVEGPALGGGLEVGQVEGGVVWRSPCTWTPPSAGSHSCLPLGGDTGLLGGKVERGCWVGRERGDLAVGSSSGWFGERGVVGLRFRGLPGGCGLGLVWWPSRASMCWGGLPGWWFWLRDIGRIQICARRGVSGPILTIGGPLGPWWFG